MQLHKAPVGNRLRAEGHIRVGVFPPWLQGLYSHGEEQGLTFYQVSRSVYCSTRAPWPE